MKKYNTHKSSLFLIELIIAIAFFALASGVCLRLFVKSHLLSREATQLSDAVNLASSAAEIFRQCGGEDTLLTELMPELQISDNSSASGGTEYTASYDEYILTMLLDKSNTSAQITVFLAKDQTKLYELPVKIHVPVRFSDDAGI